jgi:Ricin-type beta-trefoil lectin domain
MFRIQDSTQHGRVVRFALMLLTLIGLPSAARADAVTDWNAYGASAVVTAARGPGGYIDLAYMHIAMYDAVNAIGGRYSAFAVHPTDVPAGSSKEAAAIAAAYNVLLALFPAQQVLLDQNYATSLDAIPDSQEKADGIAVGTEVAFLFLASRAGDGRNAPTTYTPGSGPGDWIPTSPAPPAVVYLSQMQPFAMETASQFRGDGPPALTSEQYTADFNEIKSLGCLDCPARTEEQRIMGLFYTDPGPAQTARGFRQLAFEYPMSLADNARLFAMLYVALGDAAIASVETKYFYGFWRPITAIRQADTDGNPDTIADPDWTPLALTPNFPDYVSTHAATWGAFSETLRQFVGTTKINFTLTSLVTGTTRDFTSTDDINKEIIDARVYVGFHFRTADTHGVLMGKTIGRFVAENFFRPLSNQLVATHSQKCLDVPQWSLNDGMPVVQWACNGGDNQTWNIEHTSDGYSRLIARHSGKCLDVRDASTEDGAAIIQWSCHGGANQQWRLEAVGEGYRFVARHSGKCLDVTGWSPDDGTGILQWQCQGGANQTWLVRSP